MSFFEGLDAEKYDRMYSDRDLFQRIWGLFRPYWGRLVLIYLLVFLVGGAWAIMPVILAHGLDWLKQKTTLELIGLVSGIVLIVGVLRWLLNWLHRRLLARLVADILVELANRAFQAAVEHDLSFYDEFSSGKVLSRITTDTRDFGNFITVVTDLFSQIAEAAILAMILLTINVRLSLVIFALVPFVFMMALAYRRLARRVTQQGMRAMAEVNATIKETISGIAVAKNFRQEHSIYKEFTRANTLSYRLNVQRGLVLAMVFPSLNAVGGIATGILVYTGGLNVMEGVVTAGSWYLFLLSLYSFLYPVMNLSSFATTVQTGLAAAERVFALIDAEPAVRQIGHEAVPCLRGEIEFVHVNFRYRTSEPVLEDFNLHIRAGENLAIVGHTGAGKTSIARLIARFYEFQQGQLLVDGRDIRTFDLGSYRRQLGIVPQVPFLFSGTVMENIRYARPEATDKEVFEIANQIGGGEWIETLPHGLNTEVGERGALLSMGQRQLVALMRVLIQRPAIFILDEATASIDPFTERQIQQALSLILSSATSILIAHRLSTVKSADRIIVVRNGKIIEEGNHNDLMAKGGHYAELYNTYFRHQSLAYVEQAKMMMDMENLLSKRRY